MSHSSLQLPTNNAVPSVTFTGPTKPRSLNRTERPPYDEDQLVNYRAVAHSVRALQKRVCLTTMLSNDAVRKMITDELGDSEYTPTDRALLYARGKREGDIRDLLARQLPTQVRVADSFTEWAVPPNDVSGWNELLRSRDYFSNKSGLSAEKQRGRVDVITRTIDKEPLDLVEVKAWSTTDANQLKRYASPCKYNHSISKAFEIDALKLLAITAPSVRSRIIVTCFFTVHCDHLSESDMKGLKLAYVPLLKFQNNDSLKIGGSREYRARGVRLAGEHLSTQFGHGTDLGASIDTYPIFDESSARVDGVGISLDVIVASIPPRLS